MAVIRVSSFVALIALLSACVAVVPGTPPVTAVPIDSASQGLPTTSPLPIESLLPTLAPATLTPSEPPMVTAQPTDTPAATPTPTPSPTATPTRTPTAPPTPRPARIRTFEADVPEGGIDCNVSPEPTSIHLEWEIARATGVTLSIDGPGIFDSYDGPSGSADVPFACGERRHTYLLTTTGGDGAAVSQEIVVRRARPRVIEFFTGTLSLNSACNQTFQRNFFWKVDNAVGVTIWVDGQEYGSFTGREGSTSLPYDCANKQPPITYRIETTGPYGPHDSLEIEVSHSEPA